MWRPINTVAEPSTEPITIDDARRQCRVGPTDSTFDAELTRLIKVARDHVEKYCGMYFSERSLTLKCSEWGDLGLLPVAPLSAISSIKYFDTAGVQQELSSSAYEKSGDRFAPSVSPKDGQLWPAAAQSGAGIEVVATFGGDVPSSVQHAMLMMIAHLFSVREAVNVGNIVTSVPMAFDDLLCNDRRFS